MTHRGMTTTTPPTTPTMPTMPDDGAFMFCMREVGSIFILMVKREKLTCDGIRRPAGVIPSSTRAPAPTSNTNASTSTKWQVTHPSWLTFNVGSDGIRSSLSHRRFGGRIRGRMRTRAAYAGTAQPRPAAWLPPASIFDFLIR